MKILGNEDVLLEWAIHGPLISEMLKEMHLKMVYRKPRLKP